MSAIHHLGSCAKPYLFPSMSLSSKLWQLPNIYIIIQQNFDEQNTEESSKYSED